jgi:hypothetical protein
MKRPASSRLKQQLKTMSVDELVELFRSHAPEQSQAMLRREQSKVKAAFWKLSEVSDERTRRRPTIGAAAPLRGHYGNSSRRTGSCTRSIASAGNSKEYAAALEAGTRYQG